MKILLSVYNISGYLVSELAELSRHAEIAVWQHPCSLNAKAEELLGGAVRFIDRCAVDSPAALENALGDWRSDVFFCGGWADPAFRAVAKRLRAKSCRTVLCMDTPWQGKPRQWANCALARFRLLPVYDYVWGAGQPQAEYARRLGFGANQIKTGYYSADTKKFLALYTGPRKPHSHVFLYVGRYVAAKNMRRMEAAFLRAIERAPDSDWTLRCIGGGELWEERTIHPRIEHLGYKSPFELEQHVRGAGCFVLPSIYEPWGVVVHEFACAGLPMLCSKEVKAATKYLESGKNGYTFDAQNVEAMTDAFLKIMAAPDDELSAMGRHSNSLGAAYTTQDWAKTALSFGA